MPLENAIPETLTRYAEELGPDPDEVLEEMAARAEREDFPYVGAAVGGWLATLARMVGAERVFEFGSGFGYSAYWMARELPEGGEIVLTDLDADRLDLARSYFERAELSPTVRYEHGDAIETVAAYDGPFDVVLLDNHMNDYGSAFRAVRDEVAPGGLIAVDNVIAGGSVDPESILAHIEGASVELDALSAGVAEYFDAVRSDPEFSTVLLPVGEGVSVTHRSADAR